MTACSRTLLSHLDPVAVGKQRNGPMNGFTSMTWARLIEHVARVDAKHDVQLEGNFSTGLDEDVYVF